MRFYSYINESYLYSFLDTIKRDCKPFLKNFKTDYNRNFLWSGRSYSGNNLEKRQVRQNRAPRDTPLKLHYFIDNWFNKKFGIKARSQTIFTTSDINISEDYGDIHAIFPIGNYKIISSKKIRDVWMDILDEINTSEWNMYSPIEKKELLEIIEKKLENAGYMINKFYNNIEIMVYCKEYYSLHYNNMRDLLKVDFII